MSYQDLYELFKSVHNRTPNNNNEFVEFCRLYNDNRTTLNSRRIII